ncbi:MAG: HAD-IIB family hydrolase [Gammaproteobacteria bacterium]
MKRLVLFDLDGTLAESKAPIDVEMATLLGALLRIAEVAVISGGDWQQFETQLLPHLRGENLKKLSLLPTCGTKLYEYGMDWQKVYSEDFTAAERETIVGALTRALAATGLHIAKTWGEPIEDRGSQITFSALGQQAPLDKKKMWDPDFAKRHRIQALLEPSLPEFAVHLGGTTSIDITRRGIDKAYGIHKLRDRLGIAIEEMIFVGDALFPGGNDYPARQAGLACIQVAGPHETKRVCEAIVACLDCIHDSKRIGDRSR